MSAPRNGQDMTCAWSAQVADARVLDQAFADVCAQRRNTPPEDDIWSLRRTWTVVRPQLQSVLRDGSYRFSPPRLLSLRLGPLKEPELVERWSAQDMVVQRAMMEVLTPVCEPVIPPSVASVRHRGGTKGAVRQLLHHLRESKHLTRAFRTDVKSYYQSIDLGRMLEVVRAEINDPALLAILWSALERCVDLDAELTLVERGISKGSPLSPLLGALYLKSLDEAMARLAGDGRSLVYLRYMDDILVLADTPRTLRKAIRCVNQHFAAAGLRQHPDKTSIGRIAAGFDFLGYRFAGENGPIRVAPAKEEQFLARLHCLYETSTTGDQAAERKAAALVAAEREAHPWLNHEALADHGEATVREALRADDEAGKTKPVRGKRCPRCRRRRPAATRRPAVAQARPTVALLAWLPDCVVEYVRHYLSWATGGLEPRDQRMVRDEIMRLVLRA